MLANLCPKIFVSIVRYLLSFSSSFSLSKSGKFKLVVGNFANPMCFLKNDTLLDLLCMRQYFYIFSALNTVFSHSFLDKFAGKCHFVQTLLVTVISIEKRRFAYVGHPQNNVQKRMLAALTVFSRPCCHLRVVRCVHP